MSWRTAALPSVLACAAAAGGCNLVFGISGGIAGSSPGAGGASSSASSGSASSSSGSGTSSSGGTGGSGTTSVMVSPLSGTQLALTTVTFTAQVTGPNPAVTWSVTEPSGGKVDPQTGAYTAPATAGTYHVVATSVADPTRTGQAAVTVATSAKPVTLVATGALASATGHGSQTHLVYAQGAGAWWLFHDPSGQSTLATRTSKDFAAWTDGASLPLPQGHSQDGRDLSVAYRSLQGADVIHVTQGFHNGSDYGRYHARALVSSAQLTFGTARMINDGGDTAPDGASTTILSTGLVIDSTGWQGTPQTPPLSPCGSGDVDIYTSGVLDDGSASLDDMKFTAGVPKVLWCVNNHVLARQLVALGDVAIHVCVDGSSDQSPQTLLVNARTAAGQWNPSDTTGGPIKPDEAFPATASFGLDDWAAAAFGGQVHVVRRIASSNGFEHAVVTSAGIPSPGVTIPPTPTAVGTGLFLGAYGDGLLLAALDANAGANVLYTVFDGKQWSAWATLVSIGTSGSWLGGYAPEAGARPAVVWTQAAGASYAIAGALLP